VIHITELPYFDHPVPLPMAHRGGALYGPNVGLENSLMAFANAVALGYRYLETDVHATRDGVVFAFHDRTLDRVTDGAGRIAALSSSDVRRARIAGREPIPTLAELFEELPGARFNVDVKEDSAVDAVVKLIERTKTHDRVCLAAFSTRRIRRLRRRLGPRVATSMGTTEVAALRSPLSALRWQAAEGGAVCVQVPQRAWRVHLTTQKFVAEAHRHGLQVHVWTVNDADVMAALVDIGVDGIITDRIDTLRDLLMARGSWNEAPT
jgi:glycerophosphoryl diester phosphodiesterase